MVGDLAVKYLARSRDRRDQSYLGRGDASRKGRLCTASPLRSLHAVSTRRSGSSVEPDVTNVGK